LDGELFGYSPVAPTLATSVYLLLSLSGTRDHTYFSFMLLFHEAWRREGIAQVINFISGET